MKAAFLAGLFFIAHAAQAGNFDVAPNSSPRDSLGKSAIKAVWIENNDSAGLFVGIAAKLDKDGHDRQYRIKFSSFSDANAFADLALNKKIESILCVLSNEKISEINECKIHEIVYRSANAE